MRGIRTFTEDLWKVVEDVGLRRQVVEIHTATEKEARSIRAHYHMFKAVLAKEHRRLVPSGLTLATAVGQFTPEEQRVLEASEYIDNVVCYAEGCVARFVPREETQMAKLFAKHRVVGKAASAEPMQQEIDGSLELLKRMLEEDKQRR